MRFILNDTFSAAIVVNDRTSNERCSKVEATAVSSNSSSSTITTTNIRYVIIIEVMEMNYCFVNYNPFSNLVVTIELILFIGANFQVDLQCSKHIPHRLLTYGMKMQRAVNQNAIPHRMPFESDGEQIKKI